MKTLIMAILVSVCLQSAVQAKARHVPDISCARYMEIGIARLELLRNLWLVARHAPSEEDMSTFWQSAGVSEADYMLAGGKLQRELQDYLRLHPEIEQRVESLSHDILATILEISQQEQRVPGNAAPVPQPQKRKE